MYTASQFRMKIFINKIVEKKKETKLNKKLHIFQAVDKVRKEQFAPRCRKEAR
jgi:hypothetical protein